MTVAEHIAASDEARTGTSPLPIKHACNLLASWDLTNKDVEALEIGRTSDLAFLRTLKEAAWPVRNLHTH